MDTRFKIPKIMVQPMPTFEIPSKIESVIRNDLTRDQVIAMKRNPEKKRKITNKDMFVMKK
jgi:hypothetical protein